MSIGSDYVFKKTLMKSHLVHGPLPSYHRNFILFFYFRFDFIFIRFLFYFYFFNIFLYFFDFLVLFKFSTLFCFLFTFLICFFLFLYFRAGSMPRCLDVICRNEIVEQAKAGTYIIFVTLNFIFFIFLFFNFFLTNI